MASDTENLAILRRIVILLRRLEQRGLTTIGQRLGIESVIASIAARR